MTDTDTRPRLVLNRDQMDVATAALFDKLEALGHRPSPDDLADVLAQHQPPPERLAESVRAHIHDMLWPNVEGEVQPFESFEAYHKVLGLWLDWELAEPHYVAEARERGIL